MEKKARDMALRIAQRLVELRAAEEKEACEKNDAAWEIYLRAIKATNDARSYLASMENQEETK